MTVDRNFETTIRDQRHIGAGVLLAKFLSLVWKNHHDSSFHVDAEQGTTYMLKQPKAIFNNILGEKEVRPWLEGVYQDFAQPEAWFVVGIRTFLNARLVRENNDERAAGGAGSASVVATGPASVLPGPLRYEAEAGRRVEGQAKGAIETTGERIYAICYRKVSMKVIRRSINVDTAQLDQKRGNIWKLFNPTMGTNKRPDEFMEVILGDDEELHGFTRLQLDSLAGDKHALAVSPEMDVDYVKSQLL